MEKWVDGKEVKSIAREEKVCPETVRRYLEKNRDQTGYTRGSSEMIPSKKIDADSIIELDMVDSVKKNAIKNVKDNEQSKNASPEIDRVCSLLEQMVEQEDNLRTTLMDSDSFIAPNPNQTLMMKELFDEIKNIHGQLAEFRQELNKMRSSD